MTPELTPKIRAGLREIMAIARDGLFAAATGSADSVEIDLALEWLRQVMRDRTAGPGGGGRRPDDCGDRCGGGDGEGVTDPVVARW